MQIKSVDILGIRIDAISKEELLQLIEYAIENKNSEYIVTPYSEFFYNAKDDEYFREILNKSYLSIPDGVFTQWSAKFLSLATSDNKFVHTIKTTFQYIYTGASIVLYPGFIKSIIKERLAGSDIVYDVSKLAAEKGFKIAILGGLDFGTGNTGILAANKLNGLYPGLEIVEIYPGERQVEVFGEEVIEVLKESKADILLCCYAPVRQEKWLYENLERTGIKLGIGLGGTMDYVSGVKKTPPRIFRRLGLEWLLRPLFAEYRSPKNMVKRSKRGWFPAMIKSSLLAYKEKLGRTDNFKIYKREIR